MHLIQFARSHPSYSPFVSFPHSLVASSRKSDTGSHCRLFSSLLTTLRALLFHGEKISPLASLVGCRRIVLTHAIRGAPDSCCRLKIESPIRKYSRAQPWLHLTHISPPSVVSQVCYEPGACWCRSGVCINRGGSDLCGEAIIISRLCSYGELPGQVLFVDFTSACPL